VIIPMSIVEITTLQDVVAHCDASTTVFLDIDNTLLTCTQGVGSEQWEKAVTREALACGVPGGDAWRVSCWLWQALQNVTEMRQCEEGGGGGDEGTASGGSTADAVARMVAAGAAVVGLTARHPTLRARTAAMLQQNGIALGQGIAAGAHDDGASYSLGDPPGPPPSSADMACPLVLHRGAIFCCGPRKAAAAHALLRTLPAARRRTAVLVDDRLQHLEDVAGSFVDVDAAAAEADGGGGGGGGTRFLGFHYTRMDAVANQPMELDAGSRLLTRAFCSARARADLAHAARAAEGGGAAPDVGELQLLPAPSAAAAAAAAAES
jgi:hypothetical protein